MRAESTALNPDIGAVLEFLRCRTPRSWVDAAVLNLDTLLLDHASLELKAAQQAQKLIRRYGGGPHGQALAADELRSRLVNRMSRLAREELRHFEQVVALIEKRGGRYRNVSPSRYAAALHALARKQGPGTLVDSLVIGAIIEARSCERFFSLIERPGCVDESITEFYRVLLRSEARHFGDYLALARDAAGFAVSDRIERFLEKDAELVGSPDTELRFLSGTPDAGGQRSERSVGGI